MIYQLKISLNGAKPPIWRRILVEDDTDFQNLHNIIQLAFDWENAHLYHFYSPIFQDAHGRPIFIEPSDEGLHQFDSINHRYLDEEEVLLSDAFTQIKDKVTYTYDLGDNWEHTIELENILDKEADKTYPICTGARQFPPEEDSKMGPEIRPLYTDLKPKEIVKYVNQQLEPIQEYYAPMDVTANIPIEEWQELFDLADKLYKVKPWKNIADEQIIAIWNPELDDYVYCSVMGNAGIMEGIACYPGKDGLMSLIQTIFNHDNEEELDVDLIMNQRTITLSFDNKDMLEENDISLIEEVGRNYRGKKGWPSFLMQEPGYLPWQLTHEEVSILKQTIPHIIDISKKVNEGSLNFDTATSKWFARNLDSKGNWRDDTVDPKDQFDQANMIPNPPLLISEIELMRVKKQFEKINHPLELDFVLFPEPVQEGPNDRGFFPELMLAVDKKSTQVIHHEMFPPSKDPKKYQEDFVSMLVKNEFIPKEIWMRNEKFIAYLKPVLNFFSIKLIEVHHLEKMEELLTEMEEDMSF
ncbi:plasmid pRiA4b ORF-3 family protein [Saliterribacillus persicus]|uniref:PRiA4b ORF-3-like protein n=1 Tax=Saliterribacillus persicus TaxID=930114 RepID=A0A368YC60_9BACI|nr:plasmid pRiA4b ORF-3 family protein [Saliterribacillus persicus]RCW77269.1 pRiA4b ORF-3-like protein [Saliterribacillus persicus]